MPEFTPFTIPQSITEFGEGTPTTRVPEGNYLLELDSIVPGLNRTTNEPFISFRTKIVDGPIGLTPQGAGLPVWSMSTFGDERAWAAGRMLNAVGFDVKTLAGVQIRDMEFFQKLFQGISQACKGRRFGATLTDYTGGKVPTSQIQNPFSVAEFEAQKAAASAQAASQPPSAPAANGKAPEPTAADAAIQNDLASLLAGATQANP